jgi:alpha-tubulin suppressor-like RCC1 family protein
MDTLRRRLQVLGVLLILVAVPDPAMADAIAAPGSVLAFGANERGQLGRAASATPNPTATVVQIPGQNGPVAQVAAGFGHSLALTQSGRLYAFGSNQSGQLGIAANAGTATPDPVPSVVALPGATGPVTQIAAGAEFSLALTASDQLYGFGSNTQGQLGSSTNTQTTRPNATPSLIALPGQAGSIVKIAAGDSSSAVLTSSGQLYTFGASNYGMLGRPESMGPSPTPTVVQLPDAAGPITRFAIGERQMLAVTAGGQVFSWGDSEFGETGRFGEGNGPKAPGLVTLPGGVGAATQVATGSLHSLVATASGQLYVFGSNENGQLGFPLDDVTQSSTPLAVALPGQVGAISELVGAFSDTLVVTSSGQLYAWGQNGAGALGKAPSPTPPFTSTSPSLVALAPGTTIDAVAVGSEARQTLALVADLAVATSVLPPAEQGIAYAAAVVPRGGTAPFRWSADGLPTGLAIDPGSGVVGGTATVSGSFAPTFSVVDAYGIQTSRTLVLSVSAGAATPAPVGAAPLAGTAGVSLPLAPRLVSLKQSSARWRSGDRLASLVRGGVVRPRRVAGRPVGTTFAFSLDRPARVTFAFSRTSTRRLIGSLTVQAGAGTSTLRFEGRISRGLRLAPGAYDVVVRARSTEGVSSTTRTLRLVVGLSPRAAR